VLPTKTKIILAMEMLSILQATFRWLCIIVQEKISYVFFLWNFIIQKSFFWTYSVFECYRYKD